MFFFFLLLISMDPAQIVEFLHLQGLIHLLNLLNAVLHDELLILLLGDNLDGLVRYFFLFLLI